MSKLPDRLKFRGATYVKADPPQSIMQEIEKKLAEDYPDVSYHELEEDWSYTLTALENWAEDLHSSIEVAGMRLSRLQEFLKDSANIEQLVLRPRRLEKILTLVQQLEKIKKAPNLHEDFLRQFVEDFQS